VLLVLFFMFLGASFDIVIGFAVGYMHSFGLFKKLEMTTQRAKLWEGRFPFNKYAGEPHFASADFTASANDGLPTFVRATAPPASASTFSAFQGKGVKLGTGDSPANTSVSSSATRASVERGSTSLAGKSALVSKDGKFKKPATEINDEDLITIDEQPDVRKKKGEDYALVQDTSGDSV